MKNVYLCFYLPLITDIPIEIIEIEAGELHKNLDTCTQVWHALSELGADRKSLLINVGGGMVTDLGGFVASTYMRGVPFINVPTSLLAMVDASVGGKTAIDFLGVKNLIGSFHPAHEVIVDIDFLRTLPLEELLSGYGEVVKHATLMGGEAWREVCHIGDPVGLMDDEWQALIEKSIAYKASIVEADPTERGLRRILNIGHTVGHALEAYSHQNEFSPARSHMVRPSSLDYSSRAISRCASVGRARSISAS